MVRVIIFSLLFALYSFSATLDEKIEELVSAKTYKVHKNFIKVLFTNKNDFLLPNGNVDVIKVAQVLKTNGLLDIFFDAPTEIVFEFKTKSNNFLFTKVITDTLKVMGYNFIMTKNVIKTKDDFVWTISLKAEYLIDPVIFSKELNQRGATIIDIVKKSQKDWVYEISVNNAFVSNTIKVEKNLLTELKKSVDDYFISIPDGSTAIAINGFSSDIWYPNVVFYDEMLNVLEVIKMEQRQQRVDAQIPNGTKYIKISDTYTFNNIKRGLEILIK